MKLHKQAEEELKRGETSSLDSSRKVLDQFLREEITAYADTELMDGGANERQRPGNFGRQGSSHVERKPIIQERISEISPKDESDPFKSSHPETNKASQLRIQREPDQNALSKQRNKTFVSTIFETDGSTAPSPMIDEPAATPPTVAERKVNTPSPALYVKSAAQSWPFEKAGDTTEGLRGSISIPLPGDNSPKVSFGDVDGPSKSEEDPLTKKPGNLKS